ncbi:MAG: aspartate kinase [Candidatus Levybacteria bacterium]|nr:aspartate kinase [Candidatus Levybacteria bacterium]
MNKKSSLVLKFGGTSVSTKERILTIRDIIRKENNHHIAVVVSAVSGITDLLLSLPKETKKQQDVIIQRIKNVHLALINNLLNNESVKNNALLYVDRKIIEVQKLMGKKRKNKAFLDKLVSYGEILSSYIVAETLRLHGIPASQIVATELIVTDDNFGSAEFLLEPTQKNINQKLKPLIEKGIVAVITGFIGSTVYGETTTLGRGGSDYSASIIGLCLKTKEVQIWTDVDGVFTADPHIVENARPIPEISFQEASEMAFLGAKVLHPRTMRPAVKAGIPVRVLNTFNPKNQGTSIVKKKERKSRITAITFKRRVVLLTIKAEQMFMSTGFLAKIFDIFREANISVDLISVSEVTVSLTLDRADALQDVVKKIEKFARVTIDEEASVVSVIGEHIGRYPHAIRDVFSILDKKNIRVKMISFSAQNRNISCVIKSTRWEEAVHELHNGLLLGKKI